MPKKLSNALTPLTVKNAKPGRHADGGGLHLLVKETGARSWVYRYMKKACHATTASLRSGSHFVWGRFSPPPRALANFFERHQAFAVRELIAFKISVRQQEVHAHERGSFSSGWGSYNAY